MHDAVQHTANREPVDKHDVVQLQDILYDSQMDASEMGRRGAAAVNKLLTKEQRSKAAKKGWQQRKKKLKAKEQE